MVTHFDHVFLSILSLYRKNGRPKAWTETVKHQYMTAPTTVERQTARSHSKIRHLTVET